MSDEQKHYPFDVTSPGPTQLSGLVGTVNAVAPSLPVGTSKSCEAELAQARQQIEELKVAEQERDELLREVGPRPRTCLEHTPGIIPPDDERAAKKALGGKL